MNYIPYKTIVNYVVQKLTIILFSRKSVALAIGLILFIKGDVTETYYLIALLSAYIGGNVLQKFSKEKK